MSLEAEGPAAWLFQNETLSSGLITFDVPIKQNLLVAVVAAGPRSAPIAEVEVSPVGGPCPPHLQA